MDLEFGVCKCKLLYLKWINSQILLYSTGNCIKSPEIHHNGENIFLKMHICVQLSHFAVWQKLALHCKVKYTSIKN